MLTSWNSTLIFFSLHIEHQFRTRVQPILLLLRPLWGTVALHLSHIANCWVWRKTFRMKSALHTLENNLQLQIDPPSLPLEERPAPVYSVLREFLHLKENFSDKTCSGYFEGSFKTATQSLELPSPLLWAKIVLQFKFFENYQIQEKVFRWELFSLVPRTIKYHDAVNSFTIASPVGKNDP